MVTQEQVEKILEARVRPMLHSHGGEVRLLDCADGTVLIELLGACAGCPSADLSTKGFIEDALRDALPEIKTVELSNAVSSDLLDFARKMLNHEVTEKES